MIELNIFEALGTLERAALGESDATHACGLWIAGPPVLLTGAGLSIPVLALLARATANGLDSRTMLRALAEASAAALPHAYGVIRIPATPTPAADGEAARAAWSAAAGDAWPKVVPVPHGVDFDDQNVLERQEGAQVLTWQDSAGVLYDHTLHAWSRMRLAPAVTAGGRFRLRQGAKQRATASPAAAGDVLPPAVPATAPTAPTERATGPLNAPGWTPSEADLHNACSAIEMADTLNELTTVAANALSEFADHPEALREVQLAYDERHAHLQRALAGATGNAGG